MESYVSKVKVHWLFQGTDIRFNKNPLCSQCVVFCQNFVSTQIRYEKNDKMRLHIIINN